MNLVASSPTPQLQLITIDKHDAGSHGSCKVHSPVNLSPTKRYKYRMIALASVHAYIAFHLISWHVFGIKIWGKTAMMGVPSLAKGTINAAAIMVILILGSILIWGRGFCGWVCHMRGAIEFADWILRKAESASLSQLAREKCSGQHASSLALEDRCSFCASVACHHSDSQCRILSQGQRDGAGRRSPIYPGYEGKAFAKTAFFNFEIKPTWNDSYWRLAWQCLFNLR